MDDTTFTVDLNQSDSVFPIKVGYLAFAPLPESFYKDPKAFGEKPVSNGPYKLDHWDHNKEIALVKNPDYKGNEQPKNDGVTFKVYTDDSAAYRDIQGGNLDVMDSVPAAFTKTFKTDKKVQAYSEAGSVIQTFTIPSSLDHFKNDEEGQLRRQAISMAINRDQLIDKVLNGNATAATEFTSPKTPGYSDSLKGADNLKFNASKAKELWAKADAISKYDGQLTFSYNADGGAKPIYDAVVNQLKKNLGIDAATNPIPTFQEFRDAVTNRQMKGAFRTGWQPDYPPPRTTCGSCTPPLLLMATAPTMVTTRARPSMTCASRPLPLPALMTPTSCTSRLRRSSSTTFRPSRCTTPTPPVWLPST